MTLKELECLGIALDELMQAGMYNSVQKVISKMANKIEEKEKDESGS